MSKAGKRLVTAAKEAAQLARDQKPTTVQEEVTHLGVITNLFLQMDQEARERILRYLTMRFVPSLNRY